MKFLEIFFNRATAQSRSRPGCRRPVSSLVSGAVWGAAPAVRGAPLFPFGSGFVTGGAPHDKRDAPPDAKLSPHSAKNSPPAASVAPLGISVAPLAATVSGFITSAAPLAISVAPPAVKRSRVDASGAPLFTRAAPPAPRGDAFFTKNPAFWLKTGFSTAKVAKSAKTRWRLLGLARRLRAPRSCRSQSSLSFLAFSPNSEAGQRVAATRHRRYFGLADFGVRV